MHDWEKFKETLVPEAEDFCIHLNVKDITDVHYEHVKWVCNDFELNNLGKYYNLYFYDFINFIIL